MPQDKDIKVNEKKVKKLHVAKCIDELDTRYNIPMLKGKPVKIICNTAKKLFEQAENERHAGDEERAYILYMKYLELQQYLQTTPELKSERKYIYDQLGVKTFEQALDYASKLKDSLVLRYRDYGDNMSKQDPVKFMPNDSKEIITENDSTLVDMNSHNMQTVGIELKNLYLPDNNKPLISSRQLYNMLRDINFRVLILDTRSNIDFEKSHIVFVQCINVPEQLIIAGHSANIIGNNLPVKSKDLWSQRSMMDYIVLLDWSSTDIIPGKTLHLLQTILLKWDPQIIYKNPPLVLIGGYEDWLLTYPTFTTNPHINPPSQSDNFDDLLNGIEYPQLNDLSELVEKKSSHSVTNRSNQNFNSGVVYKHQNPSIDRSSKAAAIQMYEEQATAKKENLEEQERLAGSSLNLEKRRIFAEQNWEKLQELPEKETEHGTSQLREHELLSEMMQLESLQRDVEIKHEQLREELEELKRKNKEESNTSPSTVIKDDKESSANLSVPSVPSVLSVPSVPVEQDDEAEVSTKKRIKIMEEEKVELQRKREIMQADREKILADAREKKKLMQQKIELDTDDTSGISRSQSSPNINKMIEKKTVNETPQFDRAMKPLPDIIMHADYNQNKHRDFQAVFGNQGKGLTGLKNLGNTCYMNSILQCLNNTSYLMEYFCDGLYRKHIHNKFQNEKENERGTHGAVAEEVAAVVQALWSGQYRFISPKDLRNVLGKYRSIFRGIEQQDSHEFLTFLMDWLHSDLQISVNQQVPIEKLPPADKAWLEYTKSKESLILKLFYGQIKSTVQCSICRKESVTYDSFSNLSLELPPNANRCSISDCLKLYLSNEKIIGWNCPSCKEKREAIKKLDISKLPPVLIIHFKRFYVDHKDYLSNTYKKKQTYIDFPIKDFDMSCFSLHAGQDRKSVLYNLYGVSNHYGSMESGHYTAFCKSSCYSKWFKFDDHTVTEMSLSEVVSSAAYILFYTSLTNSALQ